MFNDRVSIPRGDLVERILKPVRKPEIEEIFDPWDDETYESFYELVVEESRHRRKRLGILGWWPIYETYERIQADPEFARRCFITGGAFFALAVAAFAAFVLPHLPWIGPRINRLFAACWAIFGW
jgi:hypothetical protein